MGTLYFAGLSMPRKAPVSAGFKAEKKQTPYFAVCGVLGFRYSWPPSDSCAGRSRLGCCTRVVRHSTNRWALSTASLAISAEMCEAGPVR